MADLKLGRLLERIDVWVEQHGRSGELSPPERYAPTRVADAPRLSLDFANGQFGTLIWATGFRPDYGWLHVPAALDRKGGLRHDGGIVDVPGLYVLGLNFMRRRKSSFMHGAEDDVHDLSAHLATHLRQTASHRTMRAAG